MTRLRTRRAGFDCRFGLVQTLLLVVIRRLGFRGEVTIRPCGSTATYSIFCPVIIDRCLMLKPLHGGDHSVGEIRSRRGSTRASGGCRISAVGELPQRFSLLASARTTRAAGRRRITKRKRKSPDKSGLLNGGASRSRTGLHGFAGRCITALLSRRKRTVCTRGLLSPAVTGQICAAARRTDCTDECSPNKRGSAASPGIWSGRRVSNSRPQPWQGCALPTELLPRGPANTALA